MRCLIDIGVQKTGSKARQHFFLRELGKLSSGAGLYPATGRAGAWHQPLFDALQQDDDRLLMRLRQEVVASGCEYAVISYEGMHALAESGIRRIAAAFPDLKILMFIRRQDEFINSMHNQLHKSHRRGLRDIENFERSMFERDSRCDYAEIARRWSACVGAHRFKPVVYRRRNCSVEGFVHAAGLPVEIAAKTSQVHNRAIDGFGMAVLRHVKAMARNDDELPALVEQAHKDLESHFLSGGPRSIYWTLSEQDRKRVMTLYEDSNEWLRQNYFRQAARLFPGAETGVLKIPESGHGADFAKTIVNRARARTANASRSYK